MLKTDASDRLRTSFRALCSSWQRTAPESVTREQGSSTHPVPQIIPCWLVWGKNSPWRRGTLATHWMKELNMWHHDMFRPRCTGGNWQRKINWGWMFWNIWNCITFFFFFSKWFIISLFEVFEPEFWLLEKSLDNTHFSHFICWHWTQISTISSLLLK